MGPCILCQLPDEVLLKIWKYLNSLDIINIETKNIFSCNCTRNVSFEKNLISKLDVTGEYSLAFSDLKFFIKPRSDLITHFNINFVYWVPKGLIVSAIIQMKQLKYLNALDTKLLYEHLSEIEHKHCKIEKVAVSLNTMPTNSPVKVISEVNVLFYNFRTPDEMIPFQGLDKLKRSEYKCLKALLIDVENIQFRKYANGAEQQMLKYDNDRNRESRIGQDAAIDRCKHEMRRVGKSLCAYYCHIVGDSSCDNFLNGLNDILNQHLDVEDLSIWNCQRVSLDATSSKLLDNNLTLITRLGRLKTLTLDKLPIYVPGTFFNCILTQCQSLKSLRIHFGNYLPPLRKLYSALCMCTSLKTLCVEFNHIIDCAELLSVLLKCTFKLDRLVIQVFDLRNIRGKDVDIFFATNLQLKFVYFVVKDMPLVAIKKIRKLFKSYSCNDPQRIYKINAGISLCDGKELIPAIHFLETLCRAGPTIWSALDCLHYGLQID